MHQKIMCYTIIGIILPLKLIVNPFGNNIRIFLTFVILKKRGVPIHQMMDEDKFNAELGESHEENNGTSIGKCSTDTSTATWISCRLLRRDRWERGQWGWSSKFANAVLVDPCQEPPAPRYISVCRPCRWHLPLIIYTLHRYPSSGRQPRRPARLNIRSAKLLA